MADAAAATTKSLHGGNVIIISDLKGLFSYVKNRRTVAFAYGFMFAFVAFTIFLAFSPSPNSSAPWFTNIFTTTPSVSDDSNRSIFSYFLPNNISSSSTTPAIPSSSSSSLQQQVNNDSNIVRSKDPSTVQNQTQITSPDSISNPVILHANQSANASVVNQVPLGTHNFTQNVNNSSKNKALSPNQTAIQAPISPVLPNQQPVNSSTDSSVSLAPPTHVNSSTESISLAKGDSGNGEKRGFDVKQKKDTALQPKKQSNGASKEASVKQGLDVLVKKMVNCDLFDGEWVIDESYPLYKPGSCSLIDQQFNCILNGRPDKDYQKYKWKPKGCSIPRLNPAHMLNLLKGKRLVFVGDSLNRNMWESLVCMLKGSVKDKSKVYEVNGRQHFRGEASYSFVFKDYGCTVEFFVSPFLVREWEMSDKNGTKKETLRLDLVGKSADQYKDADFIVFNTGHWWTHDKTSKGKDYYQEGSHVYEELNVLEAFRKALTTWGRWIDTHVNPTKSQVFFRGYSASHFSGGQWNSGGACDNEVEPIKNATYLQEYPSKMVMLEKVMRGMKTHVTYLNVTQMTDYRKDGHPSVYRRQEEAKASLMYQDCSHWCLPGVPDIWNEILYAEILVNDYQKRQAQKKHR